MNYPEKKDYVQRQFIFNIVVSAYIRYKIIVTDVTNKNKLQRNFHRLKLPVI